MQKKVLNKILAIELGCIFLLMGVTADIRGIIFGAILLCLLIVATVFFNYELVLKKSECKISFILCAVAICLINGAFLFTRWSASSKVRWAAEIINIKSNHLFFLLGVIGVLLTIPFVFSVINWFYKDLCSKWCKKILEVFSKNKFLVFCFGLSLFGIILQIILAYSKDIWVDEAFSLSMIKHTYTEMVELTATDVHPPLYYIILKHLVDGLHMILPKVSTISIAKFASVIPFILLWVLSVTKVRKEWGSFVSGMWVVAFIGMPNLISYGIEIRMYSWALLFVTISYLFSWNIIKNSSLKFWVILILSTLGACYTHYFACVAVALVWLFLLVYFIIFERKCLKRWIISAVIAVIGYLPWLIIFISHSKSATESFWKAPIGYSDIEDYFRFLFDNSALLLCVGIVILFLIKALAQKSADRQKCLFALAGIYIPVGITFIGIIISLIIRPVFISRYMYCGLACIWFGTLLGIQVLKKNNLKVCATVIMLVASVINIVCFTNTEMNSLVQSEKTREFISDKDNAVYITDDSHVQRVIELITGSESYLWQDSPSELSYNIYDKLGRIDSLTEVNQLLDSGKDVYFVECKDNEFVGELFKDRKITYIGNCFIEYSVEVWQVLK